MRLLVSRNIIQYPPCRSDRSQSGSRSQPIPWAPFWCDPKAARLCQLFGVFDTWVQNVDHFNHPGNMLVRVEPGTPHVIRLAFIDYAWSFLHQWRAHGYKTPFVAPMYDPRTLTDFATIGQAIAAVEGVQDSTIESIVNRIPDEFLTAADKKAIIEGLVWRRDNIRPLIKSGVPGVS
ncbi:MAG: hypothetical protein WDN69_24975 [Aliidongia sp.]